MELASGFGDEGQLSVNGPVVLEPLLAKLAIEASAIELDAFQPYLEDVAQIDLASGSLSAKLDVVATDAGQSGPDVKVRGRVQLDELVSLDRRLGKKFVEWRSLRVEGLDYSSAGVRISEVALAGAKAHVVRGAEGQTNVEAIFGGAEDPAPDPASARAPTAPAPVAPDRPLSVEIAKVSFEGVGAGFEDQSPDPAFSLVLEALTGTIEGLSSEKRSRARIDLKGRIGKAAPVRIAGEINPLSSDAYTDMKVTVRRVPLPLFSAYSQRYVGYRIEKGELELDLHYRLNEGHLKSTNHVALAQFGFGEQVESKDATSLPVALAVELLRNSNGEIVIELPIEGDVDDPSFSFLGLLGKTVVNLVTRVATSPLSVVAGIVGLSGDELSQIDFDPGSTLLSEVESAQLDKLAMVLVDRPPLRLGVRGRADPEVDGPGLRAIRIDEELRRSAFQSMSRRAQERAGDLSSIDLSPRERLAGLERLYRERIGTSLEETDPQTFSSEEERTRSLIDAATRALASRVDLADADWRALAQSRASVVQSALLSAGELSTDRVYVVEVEVGPVAKGGSVSAELSMTAKSMIAK